MLQARLLLLAALFGVCHAQSTSNALLWTVLAFVILDFILVLIILGFVIFRNRKKKGAEGSGLKINDYGGYAYAHRHTTPPEGGHTTHVQGAHWWNTDEGEYEYLYIGALACFCCVFWTVVIILAIWGFSHHSTKH